MSKLVFDTVRRAPPLADQIYATLRGQLRSGAFNVGDRLVDSSLAKAMAVSRTPVREALARLVADGLLETGEGGFQIPNPSLAAMDEIFDVRSLIEPVAAERATLALDEDARAALTAALVDARAAEDEGDEARFLAANYAFRAAWIACVPNARLRETILRFDDQAGLVRRATLVLPKARSDALALLQAWAQAFHDGNAAASGACALSFIQAAARYYRDLAARKVLASASSPVRPQKAPVARMSSAKLSAS
ncbi:GntR family transcriptional regulator [Microvirga antarctica]|uniref:GntR family transcriptional regulator n=1 Tax=Microvirga antarctica TaxID=2819233 RepID=UPI001B301912|nr:GntR family transcriptional regulator [Microvirga antarctica]